MCKWGTSTKLLVCIPAHLSYNSVEYWAYKDVDFCVAPIVQALNDAGILTANSCCGHGKDNGSIILHDGTELIIVWNKK